MVTCQSEDDSSKNVENGVRQIVLVGRRIGQERTNQKRGNWLQPRLVIWDRRKLDWGA